MMTPQKGWKLLPSSAAERGADVVPPLEPSLVPLNPHLRPQAPLFGLTADISTLKVESPSWLRLWIGVSDA